jgi:hypothetical protein
MALYRLSAAAAAAAALGALSQATYLLLQLAWLLQMPLLVAPLLL